jgi:hypothetical protein
MERGCAAPRAIGKPLEIAGKPAGHTTVGGDNEFPSETWFYCNGHWWLNRDRAAPPPTTRSKPVRTKPFTVYQPVPGQNPRPLFTVHAYSLEQARALVAAKVAGETIVVGPVSLDGASR